MENIIVTTDEGSKGRSFSGILLGYIQASYCVPRANAIRPVWACIATTEGQASALSANLRLGKIAQGRSNTYEFMKSLQYSSYIQRTPRGTFITLYLPKYFEVDAISDQDIEFILAPDKEWLSAQPVLGIDPDLVRSWRPNRYAEDITTLPHFEQMSVYCISMLENRSKYPIVQDPEFYVQLTQALIWNGSVSVDRHRGYGTSYATGMEDCGIPSVWFVNMNQDSLRDILAEETALYFKRKQTNGTT